MLIIRVKKNPEAPTSCEVNFYKDYFFTLNFLLYICNLKKIS